MKTENKVADFCNSKWFPSIALAIVLYLIYSPIFLSDYLMNDDWAHIGPKSRDVVQSVIDHFLFNGRAIFGAIQSLVFEYVEYDPLLVQAVRFLDFLSMAAVAVVLQRFLEKQSMHRWLSFFVVLFLFSHVSIQGLLGYGLLLISNSQPAIWFSLLAFYLFFFAFKKWRIPKALQMVIVFFVLMLAMLSMQTYAFFAMIPLSYLALADWDKQKHRIIGFFIIAIIVFVASSLAYKFVLDFSVAQGRATYPLGQQAFSAIASDPVRVFLRTINPLAYWSAFTIWTYPFPLHYTPPLGDTKETISSAILIIWMALNVAAIITEIRDPAKESKRQVIFKWLTVLVCLGFGALFLVADSPTKIIEHRPHMTLTMTGVAIFTGAYSLQILAAKFRFLKSKIALALGAFLIIMVAFGAQAGILRGITYTRMEQINFIRTELVSRDPAEYKNIIIVLPASGGCVTEPCDPWFGQIVHSDWHMGRKEVYKYALTTMGISPDAMNMTVEKQKPDTIPNDTLVIDWNKFISARKRLADFLKQQN